jgi:hypothetical protein
LYGFQRPHANPYGTVLMAMTDAVERTRWLQDSAGAKVGEVMPWLEAMSIRGLRYGPEELRAQIQATYDAGLKSWALWNPATRYREFLDGLRPASGDLSPVERRGWKAPQWELPRQRLSKLVVRRDRAADSSRARAAASERAPADSSTPRD